jgi:uncharacterized protein (UPF0216 family)
MNDTQAIEISSLTLIEFFDGVLQSSPLKLLMKQIARSNSPLPESGNCFSLLLHKKRLLFNYNPRRKYYTKSKEAKKLAPLFNCALER